MSPQMVQIINKFSFNSSEALIFLKNLGFPEKAWLPKGGISNTKALGGKSLLWGKEAFRGATSPSSDGRSVPWC